MSKTTRVAFDTSSAEFRARAEQRRATWTITRYRSLDEMKAAEYAFWARQPTHVVMAAASELSAEAYAMKGIRSDQGMRRSLVRMKRDANGAEVPVSRYRVPRNSRRAPIAR